MHWEETICALATPPGTGGIGVVRLSGPGAFAVADAVTRAKRPCAAYAGHTLHRAEIVTEQGEVIDDVLLAVFRAPRSYTGEDVVEISAHGGPVPLRRILARLLARGARLAAPGEFTQRAFLNGKMDLAQAEAVGDLIAAQTDEAHRLARRQQGGEVSRAVGAIRDGVLGVLARIEASIDFPEDVGELDADACERDLAKAEARIAALLSTADRGILYREGAQVVLAGRPNVGKSSLMNALLRTARAIVTPIPGTTRDVIEETLNLRGIPARLSDTAGLRQTDDPIEQLGVARTHNALASADVVVLVVDATAGETPEDAILRGQIAARPHLIVWNKWDLTAGRLSVPPPSEAIALSAATGWNMDALENALADLLLQGQAAPADGAVVTHARHQAALTEAQGRIAEARATLAASLPPDLASLDVRGALTALGEITGETAGTDIMTEIFSRFCIGK